MPAKPHSVSFLIESFSPLSLRQHFTKFSLIHGPVRSDVGSDLRVREGKRCGQLPSRVTKMGYTSHLFVFPDPFLLLSLTVVG